jgi:hypothetical protein
MPPDPVIREEEHMAFHGPITPKDFAAAKDWFNKNNIPLYGVDTILMVSLWKATVQKYEGVKIQKPPPETERKVEKTEEVVNKNEGGEK